MGSRNGSLKPRIDLGDPKWVLGSQTGLWDLKVGLCSPKVGLFLNPNRSLGSPAGFTFPPPPNRFGRPQNAFWGPQSDPDVCSAIPDHPKWILGSPHGLGGEKGGLKGGLEDPEGTPKGLSGGPQGPPKQPGVPQNPLWGGGGSQTSLDSPNRVPKWGPQKHPHTLPRVPRRPQRTEPHTHTLRYSHPWGV